MCHILQVTDQDIANIVSQWTGIPIEKVRFLYICCSMCTRLHPQAAQLFLWLALAAYQPCQQSQNGGGCSREAT